MRAALYARVSTEDQAKEGFSLDAQMKKLEAYCRSREWKPAGRFIDEGYSGRNVDRPAYRAMMDSVNDWDVILVMKMDRIHRNSVNFTEMMNLLKKTGKEFNSIQEKFDTTTAMGRFVMDIIQRIAQLESEQIGERVKMGMQRKARCGTGTLGSGHPYGYVYSNGNLEIEPHEASTVRMIYDLRAEGLSAEAITRALNDSCIPAKKGGAWNRQSVHGILRNPLYAGYVKWDGIVRKGEHQAIVESSVFAKVNGGLPA
ncbi:MAG: recombinase family protein [Methanomassiliicoccaceae archaeon]|nr:recombinase family protein [Methanomassiliicoccaceae archaeon]